MELLSIQEVLNTVSGHKRGLVIIGDRTLYSTVMKLLRLRFESHETMVEIHLSDSVHCEWTHYMYQRSDGTY